MLSFVAIMCGPGMMGDSGPFGEGSGGAPTPVAVENFRVLQQTQSADEMQQLPSDNPLRGRVNLLNWDGRGMPEGMFPKDESGADR